jgi:hypothetical protein
MRDMSGKKSGVAADWTQFPGHLEKSLRGLALESQETLAVGRSWALRWKGQLFHLEAHVDRWDAFVPLSPAKRPPPPAEARG